LPTPSKNAFTLISTGLLYKTHLSKMMVESKGFGDIELLHDYIGNAISERPFFIYVELLENFPRLIGNLWCDSDNLEDTLGYQNIKLLFESDRSGIPLIHQHQGMQFIQNVVGDDEAVFFGDLVSKQKRGFVMRVSTVCQRAQRTCVNKNLRH